MRRLIGLSYSPWTAKARWALDHQGVPYRYEEHVPMLGEPLLRLRARRPIGRLSVPLLIDAGRVLGDSLAIALRADALGTLEPLFPPGRDAEVRTWNERSEAMLEAGRALLIPRVLADPEAQQESLPAFVPAVLRPRLGFLSRVGAGYLGWKYGVDTTAEGRCRDTITGCLDELREALAGGPHILSSGFSYADVAMAVALQVVEPVAEPHLHLGEASRATWRNPELAEGASDLLSWRDQTYARHR